MRQAGQTSPIDNDDIIGTVTPALFLPSFPRYWYSHSCVGGNPAVDNSQYNQQQDPRFREDDDETLTKFCSCDGHFKIEK